MANQTEPALAIVIPAYRLRHLDQSLASLATQTDGRFRVYIGDDASPEPIRSVVDEFTDRLDVHYHRFSENLGKTDLVGHWQRCVSLTRAEPWLWLFSDDDVLEPDCVAAFYRALAQSVEPRVDLYRFQLDFIDENSVRSHRPADHPAYECGPDLLAALLTDRRRAWRAQDHVFSRQIYERTGGFVSFPYAIYSDFATWLRFAAEHGVHTIPGARVLWRHHAAGISSGMRTSNRKEWQVAAASYLTWLALFSREGGDRTERIFHEYGRAFYFKELAQFRPWLTAHEQAVAVNLACRLFMCSRLSAFSHLRYVLLRTRVGPAWRSVRKRVRKVRSTAKHVFGHIA